MYIKKSKDGYKYHDGGEITPEQAHAKLMDYMAEGGQLTAKKAKTILKDNSANGYELTDKQKRFFGAIAGGAKPYKKAYGGYTRKYAMGGEEDGTEGDNSNDFSLQGRNVSGPRSATDNTKLDYVNKTNPFFSQSIQDTGSGTSDIPTSTPSIKYPSRFGEFLKNNEGDILNSANYLLNRKDINSLQTKVPYQYMQNPVYAYTDRSGAARKNLAEAAYTTNKGISSSSSGGDVAKKQATFANYISGINQIQDAENRNKDAYDNQYYNRLRQTQGENVGIANNAAQETVQAENDKTKLGIQERNALTTGYLKGREYNDKRRYQDEQLGIIKSTIDANSPVADFAPLKGALHNPSFDKNDTLLRGFTPDAIKNYYDRYATQEEKGILKRHYPEIFTR